MKRKQTHGGKRMPAGAIAILALALAVPGESQAKTVQDHLDAFRQTLSIVYPKVESFEVSPLLMQGGQALTAQVGLSKPAPWNMRVRVSSSSPAIASVDVIVAAGADRASRPIPTNPVAVPTDVHLTAKTTDSDAITRMVTLLPPELIALELPSGPAYGGEAISAHVELSGPAPEEGLRVHYAGDPEGAIPAGEGQVAAGESEADIAIPTRGVALETGVILTVRTGPEDAIAGMVTLLPAALDDLELDPYDVRFTDQSGSASGAVTDPFVDAVGTVKLRGRAPDGGSVTVNLDVMVDVIAWAELLGLVEFPAEVVIAGGQSEQTFPFRFLNPGAAPQMPTLQGRLVAEHDGDEEFHDVILRWE